MARFFDAGDSVTFGSDATIDDLVPRSAMMYSVAGPVADRTWNLIAKASGAVALNGFIFSIQRAALGEANHHLVYQEGKVTAAGTWATPNDGITQDTATAVAFSMSGNADTVDPDMYINATLQAETETGIPIGNYSGDAAETLELANSNINNNQDFNGTIGFLVFDDYALTAADVNRHRWWGVAPGGPSTVAVWQPMWTESLDNKGTSVAPGTNGGSTVSNNNVPRVERCHGSMMGVGR